MPPKPVETKAYVYAKKAKTIWDSLDDNQRTGIRFGLFPLEVMHEAEHEGFNGKDLSVALMSRAEKEGGMVA